MGPIHYKTCLREAYASLRGVKGSLRGGVLLGVAYAGGYARAILSANLKKSALKQLLLGLLWLHFLVFWPFVASFPFILAFCGFISFHFGLLCLPQNVGVYGWGYRGLRGGYAALTRGELVASDKRNSQLQGHQIPQKSHSLIFEIMI